MTAQQAEAAALQLHGWGYKRIARHLGVSRDTVRGWLWHGTCAECGGPTGKRRGKQRSKRCQECYGAPAREKDAVALVLYDAGASMKEIGVELGVSVQNAGAWLSYMRRRGLPVGYRYARTEELRTRVAA